MSYHESTESGSTDRRASPRKEPDTRTASDLIAAFDSDGVLECLGALDSESAADLRIALATSTCTGQTLVVDLRGTTFLDCAAIGEFVRARQAARAAGGDLVLRHPPDIGRLAIDVVGLSDLIDVAASAVVIALPRGDHRFRALLELWSDACSVESSGASDLVFVDPLLLITEVLAPKGRRTSYSPVDAHDLASTFDGSDPPVAVRQLFLLGRVLHDWVHSIAEVGATSSAAAELSNVDAALNALVTDRLDQMEAASLLDPLTGLLNRRALDRDLLQALAVTARHREALSVVMVDVEGLKAINDQQGHAAGDQVLREVGAHLTHALRQGDNAYRIGGDEFVLVLPGVAEPGIRSIMERTGSGAHGSFTWGSASVSAHRDPAFDPGRACVLLDLADRRMLAYRTRVRPSTPSRTPEHDKAAELAEQLESSSAHAIAVEQATGLIAERFHLSIDEAHATLLRAARSRQQSVAALASVVIHGLLDINEIDPYLPSRPTGDVLAGRVIGTPNSDEV